MLIKEVPKDARLSIEVSVAARKLEFKSQCIDTGMNYLVCQTYNYRWKKSLF